MNLKPVLSALSLLIMSHIATAEEHIVDQKNKRFNIDELTVKKGDSVKFTNSDRFFHNVYSISESRSFDLGSYSRGKYKTVIFNETGTVEVRCAIHPTMKMTVTVVD